MFTLSTCRYTHGHSIYLFEITICIPAQGEMNRHRNKYHQNLIFPSFFSPNNFFSLCSASFHTSPPTLSLLTHVLLPLYLNPILSSSLIQVMDRLIEFAYTASISVGEKCVIHVMNGAVMYQIDSVVKACCDFLVQQLDPSNAIGIANFAEQIGCTELHQKAREYIYMNFSQVKA